MDASISSGDDTQATQIINAVLPQALLDDQPNAQSTLPAQQAQDAPSRSELSSSSSQNGGITQYHYSGLVSTQAESQVDGAVAVGGSQKENLHAPGDVSDKSRSNSSVQSHSSDTNRRAAKSVAEDMEGPVPADVAPRSKKPPKSSGRATVQNNADPFGAGPVRNTRRPRRRRSPSPASQDSFADPLPPEEAEKLFVANTRTFNIPLSELLKSNADNVATPQTPSSTRTSAYSFSGIERRVPHPAPPRPLNHTGEILVAETPSNSSRSSNSQGLANHSRSPFVPESPSIVRHMEAGDTQLLDESQPHAQPRDFLFGSADHGSHDVVTQAGSPADEGSTQPSSSYERVLEADPYAPNTQPLISTQPATQRTEATQPADSTQDAGPSVVGTSNISYYDPYNDLDRQYPVKPTAHSNATSATTNTPRTVGRGLAGLIPKHRRWQYHMEDDAGPSSVPAPAVPNDQPAVAPPAQTVRDTQPSDTNAVHGSAGTDGLAVQQPTRRRPAAPIASAEADVVPDSEPMDVDGVGTDRGSPENSPAKRVSKRVSQLRLDSPAEEVAGSIVKEEEEEEEEEEEDEDEVPLAATSDKGKKKVVAKAPPATASRTKIPAKRPQGRAAPLEPQSSEIPLADIKALRTRCRTARDMSAAPSSKASEDASTATARAARGKRNGVTKDRGLKSRSGTPATALKHRRTSSSDEETAASKVTEVIPETALGDGDTEPADDNYMDVDEEEAPRSKARPVKRKRVNSVATKSTGSRTNARNVRGSGTPLGSAAKKRKVSSSALAENDAPTRVFALWRQDNHYYSGTVYSVAVNERTKYTINFDDGTTDQADLAKMRLCKLMEGDQVIVPERQKAVVVDASRFESSGIVTVEIDNGEELDHVDVEAADIRIASRTLNSAWTNRMLTTDDIHPVVRPNPPLKNSPSPSKMTLGSAASVKAGHLHLRKTGLVVTMSPKQDISGKTRDKVLAAIKAAGAVIIDDWTDIFSMDGTFSRDSKRWTAKYEDIKCTVRNKNVEQVFLLSDDHNAKPKYLMALALGIPCLDYNWILESASSGKEEDWQQYLLPAGLCESLDARVSQLVDLDWGNSSEHLREITGNKVPSKVFAGMRILCVSPDYVPVPKARRNHADDGAKDSSRMVPRIILAMGASVVEAVPDIKAMPPKLLSEYDYVVVKERGDISRVPANIQCVPFAWAKDCLIAGRLLPYSDD